MKRYLCLILAVIMIFSAFSMVSVSAENTEELKTNRYYFYLPEEWENEYSSTAYIYWWNGTGAQSSFPGVECTKADIEGLYYYDVPEDVEYIMWNNGVDFNENSTNNNEYRFSCYTDTFNHKNKVYVVDHDRTTDYIQSYQIECYGNWYYYYGNGEYGLYEEKGEEFFTSRSFGGENPAPKLETNRYYFYMPEDWKNILSRGAGLYWWEGTNKCENYYPGYYVFGIMGGIYSFDVPKDVPHIIWNNYIDDQTSAGDILTAPAKQTDVISLDGYKPGENPLYPDGIESFDGMIYVINYDKTEITWDNTYIYGDWYYYYGDGEYGTTPEKGEVFYSTRQLGTIPESKYSSVNEGEITVYFLERFNRSPINITYTYGSDEITESQELSFVATSEEGTLYAANIPENCESIYFSDTNRRTLDIKKYIVHNACFEFGTTVNDKYDYKAYLLNEHLDKIDVLIGDANQDGKVTIKDATAIQKHIANIAKLGGAAKNAADFNSDGIITIKDTTAIQKSLAKLQ